MNTLSPTFLKEVTFLIQQLASYCLEIEQDLANHVPTINKSTGKLKETIPSSKLKMSKKWNEIAQTPLPRQPPIQYKLIENPTPSIGLSKKFVLKRLYEMISHSDSSSITNYIIDFILYVCFFF